MKVLSKVALFTALVVFSACSVAETPFKVYADKDKSFKQIEKFLAGKSTKWENDHSFDSTDAAGKTYKVLSFSRVYTYDDDNFATADFSYDKDVPTAFTEYQTYTHKKIALDGYTISAGSGTVPSTDGYTLYELTPTTGGYASTTSPKAIEKSYYLIKISGDKLYGFESLDVDTTAKTITINNRGGSSDPVATEFKKI